MSETSGPKILSELGSVFLCAETYVVHRDLVCMFRRSPRSEKFPEFLLGPGGHVDEGEDVLVAAVREVREETGLEIQTDSLRLKAIGIHHHLDRGEVWVNFIFRSDNPEMQPLLENFSDASDEGAMEWVPLTELLTREDVFPPSRFYFDHVLGDKPGVLHTNISWLNSRLAKVFSKTVQPSAD